MVARAVALALLALDARARHEVGEAARTQDEVDAHALVAREPQLLVVPERETLRHEGAHDIVEPRGLELREGLALGGGDVGGDAGNEARITHVGVGGSDVEVAGERERSIRILVQPPARLVGRRAQKAQLVVEVRVVEGTTVGNVEAPHAHAVDRRAERAGLEWGIQALVPLREAGLVGQLGRDVGEGQAARDRDAVPLALAVRDDLVAGLLERGHRKLLGLALDLLHREHVDVGLHEEVDDASVAGADRVDVPGGDAHDTSLGTRPCRPAPPGLLA